MEKVYNKDGSIDYIYTDDEFFSYVVGCVVDRTDKKWTVRVRGVAKDLCKVVMRKEVST